MHPQALGEYTIVATLALPNCAVAYSAREKNPNLHTAMNLANILRNTSDAEAYQEGDIVFRAGDTGKTMYVVISGSVRVMVADQEVARLSRNEFFGEMAIIEAGQSIRSATVIAAEPSELLSIDEARFLFMVTETPFFALHIMRTLADRLRTMNQNAN